MGTIKNFIEKIKSARYGKDVRQSIVDAIEQTYDDAIANGHTDMEVAKARDTYNDLNSRLEADKNKMEEKIENEETDRKEALENIQKQVNGLASGSPKGTFETKSALETANPETGVYIISKDGHIYSWNKNGNSAIDLGVYQATEIAEKSINTYHLRDDILSRTIRNYYAKIGEIETGGVNEDGTLNTWNWLYRSRFSCNYGMSITYRHYTQLDKIAIAFYDINNNFISADYVDTADGTKTFEVPLNTNYAYCVSYSKNLENRITINDKIVIIDEKDVSFNDYLESLEKSVKIFDFEDIKDGIVDDKYINYSTGAISTLSGLKATDFIELHFNNCNVLLFTDENYFTTDADDVRGLAFYNKDKTYISGIQYNRSFKNKMYIKIPENALYIRMTLTKKIVETENLKLIYCNSMELFNNYINNTSEELDNIKNELNTITKDEHPLDKIISDGGFMNIFQKVVCIGDSLTAGQFEANNTGTTTYNTKSDYGYPKHLQRILNNTVESFARGGACASNSETSVTDGHSWINIFANQAFTSENKAECYIIALGTNDIGYYGSFSGNVLTDIDASDYNNNARNSVGAYAGIIQRIKELQPKAKIFCVGIPNTRNSTTTITSANEKINEICNMFNDVYFLDMQKYGVQPENVASYKSIYYLGGHRSSQGYYQLAKEYSSYIDFIIRKNPNDFKQIPFIGTNLSYT